MLGDLVFEGLALVGEWVVDAVFGDDEDDEEAENGDTTAEDGGETGGGVDDSEPYR